MRSIQARLGLGLVISLVLVFFIQWLIVSRTIVYLNEDYISSRLKNDSEALLAAISFGKDRHFVLDPQRIAPAFQRPFSGHYYKILSKKNTIRSRSLWDQDFTIKTVVVGKSQRLRLSGPQNQTIIVSVFGYMKQDNQLTIAVAEDLSTITNALKQFNLYYGSISGLILVFLIIIQSFVLRRGFTPLQKIQSEMQQLSRGEIKSLSANVPAEVSPLVGEINRLLVLLVNRLQRSRRVVADLAHALKTPLSVLMQLSKETIAGDPTAIQEKIHKQASTMDRLMQRVLKRARLAGGGASTSYFNPKEELPLLVEALQVMYQEKQISVDTHIDVPDLLPVDREDMLELLGNILDNAYKWARQRISVVVKAENDILMVVEDDGSGVPEAEISKLTRRGMRLDEGSSGQGLGLAIAQEIIELYRGQLIFDRSSQLGGLRVQIRLAKESGTSI